MKSILIKAISCHQASFPSAPPFTTELCLSPILEPTGPLPAQGGLVWSYQSAPAFCSPWGHRAGFFPEVQGSPKPWLGLLQVLPQCSNIWLHNWLLLLPFSSVKGKTLRFADRRCNVTASSCNY